MSTIHRNLDLSFADDLLPPIETGLVQFTKGAVDSLLESSTGIRVGDEDQPMTSEWRDWALSANARLAENGMRVLGIAYRRLPFPTDLLDTDAAELERDLTFVGLAGLHDPPRPEAKAAVAKCKEAGIRPMMITGDHPLTASHVARELGIASEKSPITGTQLSSATVQQLADIVEDRAVFARVSPEHKLNIVTALQQRGEIVAMTGDGVNDAPALKKANIGVAMGVTGTDVATQAADMVLLDDNFATIVAAVEEGRVIYDNIRKFIRYILATNSGELWVMLLAPILGMPLPLVPLQILWMNLVTDGLPALALTAEPAERDAMTRPPHQPGESMFARGLGLHVIWVGLLMGLISVGVGVAYWHAPLDEWRTIVFTTLTLSQMAHVLAIRSESDSLFTIGVLSNKPLVGAVLSTVILQVALIYVPFLQHVFSTRSLSAVTLVTCFLLASTIFWAVELEKRVRRARLNR